MSSPRIASYRLTRRHAVATAGAAIAVLAARPLSRLAAQDGQLKVVATFSILGDWVANVGGEQIELTTIVPAGGDTHTFDPEPGQVARVAEADIIFAIGPVFEPWLADTVQASGSAAAYVEVTRGISLLDRGDAGDAPDEEGGEATPEQAGFDPHIWGDVANAITAVGTIRAALAEADPANADAYQANVDAYTAELERLDASIRDQVTTIPEENRKLVTSHDTFRYYARAYGFELLGTALGSATTESGDPSAADIATLVEAIDEAGVPAIFAENVVNPDLMQAIADEAGVELAPTLYTDALGEPGSEGDTYVTMMTYNTETIVTALGGE